MLSLCDGGPVGRVHTWTEQESISRHGVPKFLAARQDERLPYFFGVYAVDPAFETCWIPTPVGSSHWCGAARRNRLSRCLAIRIDASGLLVSARRCVESRAAGSLSKPRNRCQTSTHEPNHTREFWIRVERAMPDFHSVKADLAFRIAHEGLEPNYGPRRTLANRAPARLSDPSGNRGTRKERPNKPEERVPTTVHNVEHPSTQNPRSTPSKQWGIEFVLKLHGKRRDLRKGARSVAVRCAGDTECAHSTRSPGRRFTVEQGRRPDGHSGVRTDS